MCRQPENPFLNLLEHSILAQTGRESIVCKGADGWLLCRLQALPHSTPEAPIRAFTPRQGSIGFYSENQIMLRFMAVWSVSQLLKSAVVVGRQPQTTCR